jgi:hypothetical protein
VDHVVVWCIHEVVGDKIATVRLVGQLTDPGTKRFVQDGKSANSRRRLSRGRRSSIGPPTPA